MTTTTTHAPSADESGSDASREGPVGSGGGRFWWFLAAVSIAAVVAINIVVANTAVAPRTPYDEIGVLQAARLLSGDGSTPQTSSLGYYPGAGLLMAPVWWFTQNPVTVYTVSVWINIGVAVATIWPLALIGRRLSLSLPQALVAASAVMLLPSRTALSDYVLSEQVLGFFVVWAALAAFAVWDRPTFPKMSLFVLAVLAAYFTHVRALVLVLVAAIWLILFLRRRLSTAVFGLAFLAVGAVSVTRLADAIVGRLIIGEFGQGGPLADQIRSLGGTFARVAFTHTWAQLAGTAGLVAIGAVVLTVHTYRGLVHDKAVGPFGFVWGLGLAAALLSMVSWSTPELHFYGTDPRFDSWVYTRYIDPFVMVIVLVAVAAIINRVDRRVVLAAAAGSLLVIGGTVVWAVRIIPTWGSSFGPANSAGIYPYLGLAPDEAFQLPLFPTFTNDNRFWAFGSAAILVALVVFLALKPFPKVSATLLVATLAVGSYIGNPSQIRDTPDGLERAIAMVDAVEGEQIDLTVALDCPGANLSVAVNWVAYWFTSRDVSFVDDSTRLPRDAETVIGCVGRDESIDAPLIPDESSYGYSLFIVDPDLAAELEASGVELVRAD